MLNIDWRFLVFVELTVSRCGSKEQLIGLIRDALSIYQIAVCEEIFRDAFLRI